MSSLGHAVGEFRFQNVSVLFSELCAVGPEEIMSGEGRLLS